MTRRIPLIRFKYGNRAKINQELGLPAVGAAGTSSTTTTTPVIQQNSNTFASTAQFATLGNAIPGTWNRVPARFHPRALEEEEMDAIRFGGAGSDIMPIGWKPTPAKKGGNKK